MPAFDTPNPINVSLELGVGDVSLTAGERADTLVEVVPTDATKREDVAAAEGTRVECLGEQLLIRGPRGRSRFGPFGRAGSVDVRIELPAGSQLTATVAIATVRASGRLGDCRLTISMGNIDLEDTGALQVSSSMGDTRALHVAGDASISTSMGAVQLGAVDGNAVIKSSSGECRVGAVAGEVRVNAANGGIAVEQARRSVCAKTANGDIRLGEVASGSVVAQTAYGELEIGVVDGVSAFLDLHTGLGQVRSDLDPAGAPADGAGAVQVRARTGLGDITIHRRARASSAS